MIEVIAVAGIGEIAAGDDLPVRLAEAMEAMALVPRADDVLVVTSKIVSKADGLRARLDAVTPDGRAAEVAVATGKDPQLVALVLAEATDVIRAAPNVLIVRHRSGHVMANAGVDQSNLGPHAAGEVLLLPADGDAAADRVRSALARRWGQAPAVVVSDSFGRPWRYGVVNVAIGAAGLPALVDRRGECDRDGRRMEVTQVALADMVASAAGLVMGEGAEGVPAALVRGLTWTAPDAPAAALVRPVHEDLFR